MATVHDHPLVRLETLALVGVGGFAGSNLRYFVSGLVPGPDPLATLLVNTIGSGVLGFVLYEATYSGLLDERAKTMAVTGFLSSFTTYSTFAVETGTLEPVWMAGNVASTLLLGLGAVLVGRRGARAISGAEK